MVVVVTCSLARIGARRDVVKTSRKFFWVVVITCKLAPIEAKADGIMAPSDRQNCPSHLGVRPAGPAIFRTGGRYVPPPRDCRFRINGDFSGHGDLGGSPSQVPVSRKIMWNAGPTGHGQPESHPIASPTSSRRVGDGPHSVFIEGVRLPIGGAVRPAPS